MWAWAEGGDVKEERESETTRKQGISNFFFTFCTHMKPHHFQDNLCLSIMFNFSCYEALLLRTMLCADIFLLSLREWPKTTRTSELKGNNLSFPKTQNTCGSKLHSEKKNVLSPLFTFASFLCCWKIGDNRRNTHKTIGYPFVRVYLLCSHHKSSEPWKFQICD